MRKWLFPALVAVVALPLTGCKSSTQMNMPGPAPTRAGPAPDDYVSFYDQVTEEE